MNRVRALRDPNMKIYETLCRVKFEEDTGTLHADIVQELTELISSNLLSELCVLARVLHETGKRKDDIITVLYRYVISRIYLWSVESVESTESSRQESSTRA